MHYLGYLTHNECNYEYTLKVEVFKKKSGRGLLSFLNLQI